MSMLKHGVGYIENYIGTLTNRLKGKLVGSNLDAICMKKNIELNLKRHRFHAERKHLKKKQSWNNTQMEHNM